MDFSSGTQMSLKNNVDYYSYALHSGKVWNLAFRSLLIQAITVCLPFR